MTSDEISKIVNHEEAEKLALMWLKEDHDDCSDEYCNHFDKMISYIREKFRVSVEDANLIWKCISQYLVYLVESFSDSDYQKDIERERILWSGEMQEVMRLATFGRKSIQSNYDDNEAAMKFYLGETEKQQLETQILIENIFDKIDHSDCEDTCKHHMEIVQMMSDKLNWTSDISAFFYMLDRTRSSNSLISSMLLDILLEELDVLETELN